MTTFYKFPDEATFRSLDTVVPLDVIGHIHIEENDQTVHLEGWHVNALQRVDGWEEYEIKVTTPMRIFG